MITRNGIDIGNVVSNIKNDFLNTLIRGNSFPTENILHQYRTFNYRVTLAVVSAQERKSQSYKLTGFDYIIFQSHGKNVDGITPGGSAVLNQVQSFVNKIASGGKNSYDFYLDSLSIKSAMGKTGDWGTSVKMKVIEPYGMDTFLTAIRAGLGAKGYFTLDKSAVFVLKIDFVGYREDSDEPEVVPYSTRYYTLSITELVANLTAQGTQYDINAAAINDLAKHDDVNIISEPLKLKGKTVGEMMESLETVLNGLGDSRKEDSNIIADKFSIKFVNEQDEEVSAESASPISTAQIKATKMFDSQDDAGVKEFLKDKSIYKTAKNIEKTSGKDNADESLITLTVDGRMGILDIINRIIVDSYFVVDRLKVKFKGYYDKEDGQIAWWRVVPVIENGEWIDNQSRYQKIITYKIVPRKVHYTKLTSIFVPNHVAPASDYDSMIARVYEWNYTGNNKDITSLNISFNQLWARLITQNLGKKAEVQGANSEARTQDSIVLKNPDGTSLKLNSKGIGLNPDAKPVGLYAATTLHQPSLNSSKEGQLRTSAETNPLWDLSRDVYSIMNNPNEQVSLNMEILGDPMWLGTQFIDDKSVVAKGQKLFTVDGGIAIRTVDPVIRILCYAPRDINSEGFIAPNTGESKTLSAYSAHYTVNEVISNFQNGVFKQTLKGNRNTQQDMAKLNATLNGNTGDRFSWQKIDLSVR